jgi:hypothetical protein
LKVTLNYLRSKLEERKGEESRKIILFFGMIIKNGILVLGLTTLVVLIIDMVI